MTDNIRVLLVDDDADLLRLLSIRLRAAGCEVEVADGGKQALARLGPSQPQVVITDLRMEGMDGLALYDQIRRTHPSLPVIILTAHGSIPEAVDATRRGVAAYLTKPFNSKELVAQVHQLARLRGSDSEAPHDDAPDGASPLIGASSAMRELMEQVRLVADSEVNVLIQSASGTGKELVANAIHRASRRAQRPWVPLNCSAIPESLLESELFGHAKGTFTGATSTRRGLFQAADGGTLFLDEIGDMPLSAQAKLLRVLQEGEVRPLGGSDPVSVDVRVIAATHHDLEQAIEDGTFREDLYYRINVVLLEIPPLGERRDDIPILAAHFLKVVRERSDREVSGFAPAAMELLLAAPWPGNVRQLRNVVERCVVLSTTPIVPEALVRKALRNKPRELLPFAEARERFEFDYLVQLLQITEGNVTQAARLAERNRSEFYKLLNRHRLEPELFRPGSDDEEPDEEGG